MRSRSLVTVTASTILALGISTATGREAGPPNVVLIYADDIGYGDLGCYGASAVRTPNLDRLAAQGLRFTDAHSASATCTPSRYAMLTGEYAWRKKGTGILPGDAALILEPGRPTLPALLQGAGYATGCVGKWHLGLGTGNLDWNGEIKPGPLEVGFDTCFLIPATGDRVPCVYVKDHRVVGLDPADPIRVSFGTPIGDEPTGRENPELLKMGLTHGHDNTIIDGISRIGYMVGGKAARWKDADMADVITRQASTFIEEHADRPFFLYFSTHDIHVPRVPHARFAGESGCGPRGDVIQQLDWCVGEILATLDRRGLADETLVLFTSDNGPVLDDGYADRAVEDLGDHKPAGPFRGGKYSAYEGGTRVPFLARWPARIKPGVSEALICQVDLLATFAALLGRDLPADAGPDSIDILPALLGESKEGRDHLVEHANVLGLRQGPWKFVSGSPAQGAPSKKGAGKSQARPNRSNELYNLADDPGETKDLATQDPDRVREMADRLDQIRQQGHSRPPR